MERNANIFDKIGSLISGYSGYADRDGRRNCDKALRAEIVNKINEFEKNIVNNLPVLIKDNRQSDILSSEFLRKSFNTLASKIEYAPYGESGFFDNDCIKEDELAQIYQLDLELLEALENIEEPINDDFGKIKNSIIRIEQKLSERNKYISKF